jgi:hypothetical protein
LLENSFKLYIFMPMWTFKKQITIRWISSLLGIGLIIALFLYFKVDSFGAFSAQGIKSSRITMSVAVASLPIWALCLIAVLFVLAGLVGAPTPLMFTLFLMQYSFHKAFALALVCQLIISWFSIRIANGYKGNGALDEKLVTELEKLTDTPLAFIFWSRIYNIFPLRTLDLMTPYVALKPMKAYKLLPALALALFFRMLIPFNLIYATLKLFGCFVGSLPSLWHSFIFWNITMIVYMIIPRAPEIMICPNHLKKALFTLAPYSIFVAKKKDKKASKANVDKDENENSDEGSEETGAEAKE